MDIRTRYIYELVIIPIGTLNTIRRKEPHYAYFSNLNKTITCIAGVLAINGWPYKINYTAVYRTLQDRSKYIREFDVAGNKVFRVVISRKVLNPALTMLEIGEMPYPA
jgi:hypothetical protein